MTPAQLQRIEDELDVPLPAEYRATMLDYPFADDGLARLVLLPDDPQRVIELNVGSEAHGIAMPFFVGSNGGEVAWFVDAQAPATGVRELDLASGRHRPVAPDWAGFLAHLRATIAQAAREERQREAALPPASTKRPWWRFWT